MSTETQRFDGGKDENDEEVEEIQAATRLLMNQKRADEVARHCDNLSDEEAIAKAEAAYAAEDFAMIQGPIKLVPEVQRLLAKRARMKKPRISRISATGVEMQDSRNRFAVRLAARPAGRTPSRRLHSQASFAA